MLEVNETRKYQLSVVLEDCTEDEAEKQADLLYEELMGAHQAGTVLVNVKFDHIDVEEVDA